MSPPTPCCTKDCSASPTIHPSPSASSAHYTTFHLLSYFLSYTLCGALRCSSCMIVAVATLSSILTTVILYPHRTYPLLSSRLLGRCFYSYTQSSLLFSYTLSSRCLFCMLSVYMSVSFPSMIKSLSYMTSHTPPAISYLLCRTSLLLSTVMQRPLVAVHSAACPCQSAFSHTFAFPLALDVP